MPNRHLRNNLFLRAPSLSGESTNSKEGWTPVRVLWKNPRTASPPPFQLGVISIATLVSLFNFAACYFRSFVFPFTPLLPWGDAVGFLNNGTRIVAGRLPYRDYFAFLPPGTELTYALFIKAFGARSWIPNLMIACLAAATAFLMTLVAAQLMRGPITGLAPSRSWPLYWFCCVAIPFPTSRP
jgi:hypothetical protein